jgi:hypothetical protein
MFRRFLSLSAGVLTLFCVTAIPGPLHAQRIRGGFHPRVPLQFNRQFIDPRFGRFSPSFDRRFIDPRFGRFNPVFDRRLFDPRFGGF